MRRLMFCCLLLGTLSTFGCAKAEKAKPLPIEEVPADFMKTAKDKLPDITFDQALKRADGSYEVRGKDKNGKIRDIDIAADGTVLAIE